MNLFIACSASDDLSKEVVTSTLAIIQSLAETKEYDLVIGGSTSGLMRLCYEAFEKEGNMITGVVASKYQEDLNYMNCDLQVVTENTFDRLKEVFIQSDACLFLPGGIGTMTEFLGMLEEKRTYPEDKPMILYNETHLFDPLLQTLELAKQQGLICKTDLDYYQVASNEKELFDCLENYRMKTEIKIKE